MALNGLSDPSGIMGAMKHLLRPGSKVRLKTGSPPMTVDSVVDDNVCVKWFADGKLHDGVFHPDALEVVDDGAPAKPREPIWSK